MEKIKLCKDCEHFEGHGAILSRLFSREDYYKYAECLHNEKSVVSGQPIRTFCDSSRANSCGQEGINFQPKKKTKNKRIKLPHRINKTKSDTYLVILMSVNIVLLILWACVLFRSIF